MSPITAREAAYQAVLSYLKTNTYIDDTLATLSLDTIALARQIAYGTVQRLLTLEFLARQLAQRTTLSLKPKEKALLYTALYQAHYLQGAPLYAITNETVALAKKHCHPTFVAFLNALLRAYGTQPPSLPKDNDPPYLSIRHSYPLPLVQELLQEYGLDTTQSILTLGNEPAPTMARVRTGPAPTEAILTAPFPVVAVDQPTEVAASPNHYLQNVTPVYLMGQLAPTISSPDRILDLCAAPGGKLILAHDLYPSAALFANDVSSRRLKLLEENLTKYAIDASLTCSPADQFPAGDLYSLIILDVPCSNTGVLGKRPEARWRFSAQHLQELKESQMRLIAKAVQLLAPQGIIWYLTCSILRGENENLTDHACESLGLTKLHESKVLPNAHGWDGGYACALSSSLAFLIEN